MNFQPCFQFTILHDYFRDGMCTAFGLSPLADTRSIMKNYHLRLQNQVNTYTLYAGTDNVQSPELLDGAGDLYFQLLNFDKYFNNYTNIIPLLPGQNEVLFISNEGTSNTGSAVPINLTPVRLPYQRLCFEVNLANATSSESTLEIRQSGGAKIYTATVPKGVLQTKVDIRSWGAGVYDIWVDGKRTKSFFGTPEALGTQCYGIVHFTTDVLNAAMKQGKVLEYQLHFEARDIFSEYAVVIPSGKKIKVQELTIQSSDATVYNGPVTEQVGLQPAQVFTSQKTVKISQDARGSPVLNLKYNNEFSTSVQEIQIDLPAPQVSGIFPRRQPAEDSYYARSIIYV